MIAKEAFLKISSIGLFRVPPKLYMLGTVLMGMCARDVAYLCFHAYTAVLVNVSPVITTENPRKMRTLLP